MILPVSKLGKPILRQVAEPFTEREIRSSKVQALAATCWNHAPEIGVGGGAPGGVSSSSW